MNRPLSSITVHFELDMNILFRKTLPRTYLTRDLLPDHLFDPSGLYFRRNADVDLKLPSQIKKLRLFGLQLGFRLPRLLFTE